MAGKIIGSTIAMDKIAVEFDDRIWNDTGKATAYGRKIMCGSTEFTTDANGKGKPGHCAYFYPLQVQLFSSNPAKKDIQSALDRKKLLLLSL